jgi:hypothetical protein
MKSLYKIEATLVNPEGQGVYLGRVKTLKAKRYKSYLLEFDIPKTDISHMAAFDRVILHEGRNIVRLVNVKPFFITTEKTASLTV